MIYIICYISNKVFVNTYPEKLVVDEASLLSGLSERGLNDLTLHCHNYCDMSKISDKLTSHS